MASQSPPPLPDDTEVVRNIEVLAAFVAKAGAQFEQLARINTAGDPKFGFLLGDGPLGSEAARSHAFYQWKKQRLEQRVFASDGSDDLQLKICAMVDEVRTPATTPLSETHALDEVKHFLPGAVEKKILEAKTSVDVKSEPLLSNHLINKPNYPLPILRGEGNAVKKRTFHEEMRRPQTFSQEAEDKEAHSTAENKRSVLQAASQGQSRRGGQPTRGTRDTSIPGDSHTRTPIVISERAQKAEFAKANERDSPSGGPSDAPRAAGAGGAVEATEKHSKESFGLRLLKSALADYVKEVLKPAWKEGNMSKEAFKSIVKKVVDKVVGSLQAHQIPKSQENVDQYMTQSEVKISKLVQGYVDRFKKN